MLSAYSLNSRLSRRGSFLPDKHLIDRVKEIQMKMTSVYIGLKWWRSAYCSQVPYFPVYLFYSRGLCFDVCKEHNYAQCVQCLSRWNAQFLCTVRHYIIILWSKLSTTVCLGVFFRLGDRLSDFYVGVTDFSPYDVPPHPHPPSYKLCRHYWGAFLQEATETIACSFPVFGRYIVIQLRTAGTPLSLCEVEAYTGKRLDVAGELFLFCFLLYCLNIILTSGYFLYISMPFMTILLNNLKSDWQKPNEIKFVGAVKLSKPRSRIASQKLYCYTTAVSGSKPTEARPPRWFQVTFYFLSGTFSSKYRPRIYKKCSHEAHDWRWSSLDASVHAYIMMSDEVHSLKSTTPHPKADYESESYVCWFTQTLEQSLNVQCA